MKVASYQVDYEVSLAKGIQSLDQWLPSRSFCGTCSRAKTYKPASVLLIQYFYNS